MKTAFGLPAHPLFVHIPIVLIPLAGIGTIAIVVSPRARARFGWLTVGIAIVAGMSTQLAISSGQALEESVPRSAALRQHTQIAESIRPLILFVFLVGLASMLLDRRSAGAWPFSHRETTTRTPARVTVVALGVAAVLIVTGTDVRLAQIGHNGAKATWERTRLTERRSEAARRGR